MARLRAMVTVQARNSPPVKLGRSREIWSHASEATSSASAPTRAVR
ncbi:hypothetical protein B0E53_06955 [Micromonospora sp. MH33]|nr:hypothetical protein B0E53_06955 [Micromonospora sp. MH33]